MVKWLNHVTIAAPRNGSTTHTVDPSSASGVVAGTPFTPTAGRFLVCFSGGSVTSTTPSGWTLPTGGNVVANGGLYIWYKTAAGGDTVVTTHNGSNYPCVFDFYEFPAGTSFVQVAGQGNVAAAGGAGPSLSGLTASSDFRCAAVNQNISGGTAPTFTWSNGTEAVDTGTPAAGGTDGYGYSLTYQEDQVGATYSSAATSTITITAVERLVLALDVPAAGSGATVDPAIITLQGVTPVLTGSGSSNVSVDSASVALQGVTPALSGSGSSVQAVDPASVNLVGQTPSISGSGSALMSIDSAVLNLIGVTPQLSTGTPPSQLPVYRGEEQIQGVYIGDVQVLRRYKGEVQLW